ncbi:glycosyltransferase family 2 protein [Leptospira vanthielii]|uniref:Glycosyltransferase-like protein, family 2 n=1 Tax=Leptospira vanthielii serovar Holland str. Waz Holland = ATCC 700522 TaxID=1218591 RepID=N1W7L6_9LEPT|nr:glycosyltransferase [Leptospira vanthielii]EMY69435.1 glycosyltransferase-like protein, family 2 [Leptospira vanthielii serovar Holland str. Waz Holland = ATCC 700522]
MNQKPLISIIMNCYNSATYLKEAIDSVFAQTYSNWEIIFWDNQSTDESAEIFKSYKDKRCQYFYAPEHTTLGEARNLAVMKVSGEWIGFLDCDDIWLPEKLERQIWVANEYNSKSVIYGKMKLISETHTINIKRMNKKYEKQVLPSGEIFLELLKDNFIPLSAGLIYKETYFLVGGISNKYKQAEDYEIFIKIARIFPIYAIQETLIFYRLHDRNITIKQAELNYIEALDIIENLKIEGEYPDAKLRWHTLYILFLFRRLFIIRALSYFFSKGSLLDLIKVFYQSILK